MSRPRDQGRRRSQILEAASRCALKRGLYEFRVKDVANELGVTEGAILYYYRSLSDLRLEIYARAARVWFEHRAGSLVSDAAPAIQLAAHVQAGLSFNLPEARLLNAPLVEISVNPAFNAVAESLFHNEVARYQVILERGVSAGEFSMQSDVITVARNLYSLEETYRMHVLAGTSITPEVGAQLVLSYAHLATGRRSHGLDVIADALNSASDAPVA